MKNKYNLNRTIPESIKREVRQNSRFGCVICGNIPYDYEHVDPEYKDAKEHDANKITLLCPNCHARVTRGQLTKITVKKAMQEPYNLKKEEIKGYELDFPKELGDFIVRLGELTAINVENFLCVDGEPLLTLEKPEGKEICIINANFKNKKGKSILRIEKNEWYTSHGVWDILVVGSKIEIKERKRKYSLLLNRIENNIIEIEKIDIYHKGVHIYYDGKNSGEFTYNGLTINLKGMVYKNSKEALRFENGEIQLHSTGNVYFKGLYGFRK